jgi:glycosyltransferase involved in cell wall biosynthesis
MTRTLPSVTIGMPVFNGGKYLRQALDSLVAQDYGNINIIISDNASNDETEVICRNYASKHKNILYVRNRRNIGALGNFKKVLKQSTGEYFMWAASDDVWASTFVSTLIHELETHPEAGVAMSAVGLIDEMSEMTETVRFENEANPNILNHHDLLIAITDYGLKKKKYNYFIYGLYRRDLLAKAIRFYPNVFAADRILMCELALATQFRYVNEIFYFRRVHSVNVYERYPSEKFSRAYKLDRNRYEAIPALGLKLLFSSIVPLNHKRYISLALRRFRALIEHNIKTEKKLLKRKMKHQVEQR